MTKTSHTTRAVQTVKYKYFIYKNVMDCFPARQAPAGKERLRVILRPDKEKITLIIQETSEEEYGELLKYISSICGTK